MSKRAVLIVVTLTILLEVVGMVVWYRAGQLSVCSDLPPQTAPRPCLTGLFDTMPPDRP